MENIESLANNDAAEIINLKVLYENDWWKIGLRLTFRLVIDLYRNDADKENVGIRQLFEAILYSLMSV